jgi:VWFA-related protein
MKLSLLLVMSTLYAQSQPDVIRSTTRLVQMSVVAVDRSGHPVLDLKKEDFRLLDENKQRDIRVFNLNSFQPKPRPGASGIYSNAEPSGPSAITIIVIDSMNTKWTDQSRATRQLIQFLRQIQPEDHVAIYSINGGGGFQVLHGFTRDSSDLVKTRFIVKTSWPATSIFTTLRRHWRLWKRSPTALRTFLDARI